MASENTEEQETPEEDRPPEGCVWVWYNRGEKACWSIMLDDGSLYHKDVIEFEGHGVTRFRSQGFKIPPGPRALLEFQGNIACYQTAPSDS